MWGVTAWAFATWLRFTLLFVIALAAGGWWLGVHHGGFVLLCVGTAVGQLYVTRSLVREWCHEARLSWWWTR